MNRLKIVFLNFCLLLIIFGTSAQVTNPKKLDKRWKTDTTKRTVDLQSFKALLPRDHFPVINYPFFLEKEQGYKSYYTKEPVISVEVKGEARAYPLNILTYHEMANDTIQGIPILVTYCPLCNSGIVYDRRFRSYILEFGVSGMLRKSDMVMWDKQTESWWQQLTGEALVGELAGSFLSVINSQIISVEQFFKTYPYGKILTNKLGIERLEKKYGKNVYTDYDDINKTSSRFVDWEIDNRLPMMERVVDIISDGERKIYPLTDLTSVRLNPVDFQLFTI